MAKKKKEDGNKGSTVERKYLVVDQECWDGISVFWKDLTDEIIDDIPGFLIYNVPSVLPSGEIETKTLIYLGELNEEVEKQMDEEFELKYYKIPEKEGILIVIPQNPK